MKLIAKHFSLERISSLLYFGHGGSTLAVGEDILRRGLLAFHGERYCSKTYRVVSLFVYETEGYGKRVLGECRKTKDQKQCTGK